MTHDNLPITPPESIMGDRPESHVWHRALNNWEPIKVIKASGLYYTLEDGRVVLDGVSGGAAVSSVGHAHPKVIAAMQEYLAQGCPSYAHTYAFTTSPAEELADLLVGDRPGGLDKVFFISSGSEANDSAMKMARQYHIENGQPERVNYIARDLSYHGNTIGALSLSGHKYRRAPYEPILSNCVGRVPACHTYRGKADGESDESYVERLSAAYEAEFERLGGSTVAAFWAEPVVGAATGCATAIPGYFPMLRRLCDKYGALLVLDEVMSGMGRTGSLHAWEQENVTPDIQVIAKGLGGGYAPISAVLASEKVTNVFKQGSGVFVNGHTYSAHPIACAAALAVQKVIREEKLVENAKVQGKLLEELLRSEIAPLTIVGDVRGRGLFWGIEYVEDKANKTPFDLKANISQRVHDAAMALGLVIFAGRGCADGVLGDHSMVMPSLTVSATQIRSIVHHLKSSILAVQEELGI